ncbi:class I SAM-dependent RNA methyltransferase [Qipengyuania sediminis]|uniref:class I SAM-dependent RNA methyltransferase n=1 Tax=Qipengyuania sediminis TaxID=1532023 RepID=UPI001059C7A0|nr:class I SAM-dependent RNA methyltransferase [Qipengyuania sediminis]
MSDPVLRIAAKGDGVTATGRHVPFGVPGDTVESDGRLTPGPHRATPPCRHFPECGGCQLQHADEPALAQFVTQRVLFAAESQGLSAREVLPVHLSPPRTRRRATLHGQRSGKGAVLGFRAEGSHHIVDMRECHVLLPALFALVAPLRALIAGWGSRAPVDVSLALTDQGVDCGLCGLAAEGLGPTEALLDFARAEGLARLSLDDGFGARALWEPQPVTVTIGNVPVALPPGGFLQATADGESMLSSDARTSLTGARTIADLFAGLGTFAFALSPRAKVLAVEAAREAHLACKAAAAASRRPVHALHRDLFRAPLQPAELDRFEAVLLDPPRAGARDQVAALAAGTVPRIAYISCNPASWARDAKVLVDAGYRLETVRPVGQFRWSTHVELTSLFVR